MIEAHETEAFRIADQIVGLTDWTFDGLDGWKNTDPDLMQKLGALLELLGRKIRCGGGMQDSEGARAIAYAKA